MRNKKIILSLIIVFAIARTNAQTKASEVNVDDINAITTAAPFLLISPDARSGAMGDVGVATSPDRNSQHHNPAKAAFNNEEIMIGINYTPWMAKLVTGVFLSDISYTNKLNERSAWATSFKIFKYGDIQLTNNTGENTQIEKPYELALDGTYALKLNESFSLGVTGRYIRSDFFVKAADTDFRPINTISFDVSGYYESAETNYGDFNGIFRGGFNIANIGPKVSFTEDGAKSFIPTNLKLGAGFDFILDDYNQVEVALETTKLLVPTPQKDIDGDGILDGKDNNVGFFTGMFQSFGDAPGGFKEEMREFTWAIGSEYKYNDAFAFRAGYFHENAKKGARNYFTVGAGFKFRASTIDFSYLFNATQINNPLENTLRFSIGINLGESFDYFQ